MSRYRRHIFVCTNRRAEGHPKGCCATKGGEAVRDALKKELGKHGLNGLVRTNGAGCLDACAYGIAMVIYPEGVWYAKVTLEDVPEIVERTIIRGEVIQRLLVPDPRYAPETVLIPPLQAPGLLPHE